MRWCARACWLWLLGAGCGFRPAAGGADGHLPGSADAGDAATAGDATSPGDATACVDVDGLSLHICLAQPPSGSDSISTATAVDTSTLAAPCAMLSAASDPACVIAADTLTLTQNGSLSGSGSAPLVLLATTITVDGVIDVASHNSGPLSGQVGPMADGAACETGTPPTTGTSGGGAGGSYGTSGSIGGDAANAPVTSHGVAGAAIPLALHGGCAGQNGATTGNADPGGASGAGGGVVILIASTINIGTKGVIDASGAGGGGAPAGPTSGGGGGGAGGLIVLQAPTITPAAGSQVFANGGGGGGATNGNPAGGDGKDPMTPSADPTGGVAPGAAGNGGDGYYTMAQTAHPATTGQSGMNSSDGGGGGGGGAGIIHTPAGTTITAGTFSPAVSH